MTRLLRLAALILGLLPATAWAAEFIVLGGTGGAEARYARGTVFQPDQAIDVQAQETPVLMSEAGAITTIKGPASVIPRGEKESEGMAAGFARLGEMLRARGGRSALAAVRGPNQQQLAEASLIDVTSGGNKCVSSASPVVLWRVASPTGDTFSLRPFDSVAKHLFDWPAGTDRIAWPAEVPLRDRTLYAFTGSDGTTTSFRVLLHAGLAEPGRALLFFAENECRAQAAALVNAMVADNPR